MNKTLKVALFATLVIAAQAFTPKAHAVQLNIEVDSTTNPWFVENSVYCVNPNEKCLNKVQDQDTNIIAVRKARFAPDNSNISVVALAQSVSYEAGNNSLSTTQKTQNLNSSYLFTLVNQYRTSRGLKAFTEDERICNIAEGRAPELYNEIFGTGYMHQGFREREISYWATENMIYEFSEEAALSWWQRSGVHNSALLGDYEYSCVRCSGNTCSEIFTNFVPKL